MASINFRISGTSEKASIICRFSHSREVNFRVPTGFVYDASRWSKITNRPKDKNSEAKNLSINLDKLAIEGIEQFNKAQAEGSKIDKQWLKLVIDDFFNRTAPDSCDFLTECAQHYINQLPYKVSDTGEKVGVSPSTVSKYRNILKLIIEFEAHTGKKYLAKDVNTEFRSKFIKFLSSEKNITANTIGRYIRFVKTFIVDARKRGIDVSHQIEDFKGYTLKTPKVILSFDELEQIKQTHFTSDKLEIARDWLIVGCYTGQRVSDILRMNPSMIIHYEDFQFIELVQTKGKKTVQIPIHAEVAAIILKYDGSFPPVFSNNPQSNSAIFNRYLKTVAKQSGLTESTESYLRNEETSEYEKGYFEKWRLITSHTCRRSFASNFYGRSEYPTPLLMNVTAHATEKQFLEYIGRKPMSYSVQLAAQWAKEALNTSTVLMMQSVPKDSKTA